MADDESISENCGAGTGAKIDIVDLMKNWRDQITKDVLAKSQQVMQVHLEKYTTDLNATVQKQILDELQMISETLVEMKKTQSQSIVTIDALRKIVAKNHSDVKAKFLFAKNALKGYEKKMNSIEKAFIAMPNVENADEDVEVLDEIKTMMDQLKINMGKKVTEMQLLFQEKIMVEINLVNKSLEIEKTERIYDFSMLRIDLRSEIHNLRYNMPEPVCMNLGHNMFNEMSDAEKVKRIEDFNKLKLDLRSEVLNVGHKMFSQMLNDEKDKRIEDLKKLKLDLKSENCKMLDDEKDERINGLNKLKLDLRSEIRNMGNNTFRKMLDDEKAERINDLNKLKLDLRSEIHNVQNLKLLFKKQSAKK